MSKIYDLGEGYKKLPGMLIAYEKDLSEVEENIKIEGKRLEIANREQAVWQSYYDERRVELNILVKFFENEIARKRGKHWVRYSENYSFELGPRDKDQYINNEDNVIEANTLLLEVLEVHKKYEAVVDAYRSRGFALRNITNIRVAAMEDVII